MKPAFLSRTEKGKVRCLACQHYCLIGENKVGICGIRKNIGGKLQLLAYGKVIAKHLDPIEKKPLYHFLPGTRAYSIGTVGCNFRCGFCQNWSISQEKQILGEELLPKEIKEEINNVQEVNVKNVSTVAYTYNEPTIFFEYAYDIAHLLKDKKHVFVSNGYFTDEALEKMDFLDAINIDLKSFSEKFYQKNCGAKLQPVLDNIKKIYEKGIWLEITTLLIPGENDSEAELRKIARFIAAIDQDIPWHVSAFHPDFKMVDKQSTSFPDLLKAFKIGKEEGLNYIYLGNVRSVEHNSTYCQKCQKLLIKRESYHIFVEGITEGKCKYCGCRIKGVWE